MGISKRPVCGKSRRFCLWPFGDACRPERTKIPHERGRQVVRRPFKNSGAFKAASRFLLGHFAENDLSGIGGFVHLGQGLGSFWSWWPRGPLTAGELRRGPKPGQAALTAVMRKLTVLLNRLLKNPDFNLV